MGKKETGKTVNSYSKSTTTKHRNLKQTQIDYPGSCQLFVTMSANSSKVTTTFLGPGLVLGKDGLTEAGRQLHLADAAASVQRLCGLTRRTWRMLRR